MHSLGDYQLKDIIFSQKKRKYFGSLPITRIEDFSYFSDKDKENLSMFVLPRSQIKAIFEVYLEKDEIIF